MTGEVLHAWTQFLQEIEAVSARLRAEAADLTSQIASLTADLDQRFSGPGAWKLDPARVSSLQRFFDSDARLVLLDTLEAYVRLRADERLPRAFQEFRSDLKDAARKLPATAEISPREFLESLPQTVGTSWKVKLAVLRRKPRSIPIRAIVLSVLGLEGGLERRIEGRLYLFQAQAALALLDPWQALRYHAFRQIRGEPGDYERLDRVRNLWKQQVVEREQAVQWTLDAFAKSAAELPQRLTEAVITNSPRRSGRARHRKRRARDEAYWARQRRAVQTLVDTERSILQLGHAAIHLATDFADSAREEQEAVREELLSALSSLREWGAGRPDPIPPPKAQLIPAAERAERWSAALRAHVESLLPGKVESLEPRRPLPAWRAPWRNLEPRQMFLSALAKSAETAADAFSDIETSHKSIIREIERAREVVAYGIETSQNEPESGDPISRESVANAILLLEHQGDELARRSDSAEPGIVMATASCFYQFHLAFEQGTLSLASHLAREGGYRALRRATQVSAEWMRRAGIAAWDRLRRANTWFQVRIGWQAPPELGLDPVERWHYLSEDLAIDFSPRHLPLIYTRLFRIEPVEDPRFLVGREVEMAALAQAKRHWETGRLASVVVIGERGSGKTSLLNCGVARLFGNVSVVRSRFRERILTAEGLRSFLATQLQLEGQEDLIGGMQSERRVILLEEVERTFLRVVGGTAALQELLRIIAATSGATLWVLSMATAAFRLLNASEGAGRFFSHRINASSVEPEQLRNAILQRHHLSGLRLEFAPPASGDGIEAWIRARIAATAGPEAAFFDRLYVHSDGVFRSAFGLWLKYIDRAEGGVLRMGSPEDPDYEALIRGLAQDDLFSLQMILQHGSLTVEEHARIFDCDVELSRARIAHLSGREIIEPEPDAPGHRIRPEAGALVRSALSGQNLI